VPAPSRRPRRPAKAAPPKRLPRSSSRPPASNRPRRPGSPAAFPALPDDGLERLQKVLAAAGIGSRRACEELITTGRVEVDREVVTVLGTRVDPLNQQIRVDGERLPSPSRVVYLLNKPVGVVTTNYDPSGRPRVVDLVPTDRRLFPIGRLDRTSEGLILVTNDGELGNLLTHPRYGVEKRYLVQVAGVPTPETIESLRQGVALSEATVHAKRVTVRSQHKQSTVLEMVLDEGRNREIRRMLAALGHKVQQLKRIAVGDLTLGNLLPGQWRRLSWEEIEKLRRSAIDAVGKLPPPRPPRGRAQGPRAGRRPPGRPATSSRGRPVERPAGPGPGRPRRPGKASSWRKGPRKPPAD
jgi:23S rRNA pseudouridine2605 synthase